MADSDFLQVSVIPVIQLFTISSISQQVDKQIKNTISTGIIALILGMIGILLVTLINVISNKWSRLMTSIRHSYIAFPRSAVDKNKALVEKYSSK